MVLLQMACCSDQVSKLESQCKGLEEAKYASEKELLNFRELAQKLEGKRSELEAELSRTEDALEKVGGERRGGANFCRGLGNEESSIYYSWRAAFRISSKKFSC